MLLYTLILATTTDSEQKSDKVAEENPLYANLQAKQNAESLSHKVASTKYEISFHNG